MSAIEAYVRQVMELIPPASPERGAIEVDLRSHLEETAAAESSVNAAVSRMGAPRDVALAYGRETRLNPASFGQRVLAFAIDVLVGATVVAATLFLVLANGLGLLGLARSSEPQAVGLSALFVILGVASISALSLMYFPLMEWRFGQTLGKKLVGIHVVTVDGLACGLGAAVVRRIPFFLEFFWIDAIVALFSERRQRAFDMVAGTLVVECPAAAAGTAPDRMPASA